MERREFLRGAALLLGTGAAAVAKIVPAGAGRRTFEEWRQAIESERGVALATPEEVAKLAGPTTAALEPTPLVAGTELFPFWFSIERRRMTTLPGIGESDGLVDLVGPMETTGEIEFETPDVLPWIDPVVVQSGKVVGVVTHWRETERAHDIGRVYAQFVLDERSGFVLPAFPVGGSGRAFRRHVPFPFQFAERSEFEGKA